MNGSDFPVYVARYFWGDNLKDLTFDKHKNYIIQTLLEKADIDGLRWLFHKVDKGEVKRMLPQMKLSPKTAHFWQLYLS